MGVPPAVANGTNRIGILLQSITSISGFKSKGITPTVFSIYIGISALIGSLIGAKIAITIKGALFNKILAVIMLGIVLFMVFKPKKTNLETAIRTHGKYRWLSIVVFFGIGIYGGFIQAGVGILILLALTTINHTNLLTANAIKAVVVGIYTIGALAVFAYNDQLNYLYGIALAIGNAAGGWIGSRWAVQQGEKIVKIALLIMVCFMAFKLWKTTGM